MININNQDNLYDSGTWIEPWDIDRDNKNLYWRGIEVKIIGVDADGYLKVVST